MLKNYLKVLMKVLRRRLFFTAISLFGIGFTLTVLVVFAAIANQTLTPSGPEQLRPRLLTIDTLVKRSPNRRNTWTDNGSMTFFESYVRPMETPELVTIHSNLESTATFQGGAKVSLQLKRTDAEFWRIFEFDFIEGRPFTQDDLDHHRFLVVINETTRAKVFGDMNATGQTLRMDSRDYQIVGVVRDVPILQNNAFAEVWAPLHTSQFQETPNLLMGEHRAVILARSRQDFPRIKAELAQQLKSVVHADPNEYNYLNTFADSRLESLARETVDQSHDHQVGIGKLLAIIGCVLLLFMSLPAINLINLNVSRIMERASEIGVRKAFGASTRDLVMQFLLENLVLTFFGGLLGILGAAGVLSLIESSAILPYASFDLNWRVILAGLGFVVVFGLLSGVVPAWKMSRLPPAQALKGGSR